MSFVEWLNSQGHTDLADYEVIRRKVIELGVDPPAPPNYNWDFSPGLTPSAQNVSALESISGPVKRTFERLFHKQPMPGSIMPVLLFLLGDDTKDKLEKRRGPMLSKYQSQRGRVPRCLNCNECSIAVACPALAFRRVPADQPYLLRKSKGPTA
jgi:hypothetical protein